ncbi:MAG: CsbD family protein [Chloroflexi bacterium]|nr:CsbD family protein [Chloroflexota bacterium]
MNKDILKGKWLQIRGDVKQKWGELTDDEIDQIEGNTEKMVGKLQEKYGFSRERAQKEIEEFQRELARKYQ